MSNLAVVESLILAFDEKDDPAVKARRLNEIWRAFKRLEHDSGNYVEVCNGCNGSPHDAPEVGGESDPNWKPCKACDDGLVVYESDKGAL